MRKGKKSLTGLKNGSEGDDLDLGTLVDPNTADFPTLARALGFDNPDEAFEIFSQIEADQKNKLGK